MSGSPVHLSGSMDLYHQASSFFPRLVIVNINHAQFYARAIPRKGASFFPPGFVFSLFSTFTILPFINFSSYFIHPAIVKYSSKFWLSGCFLFSVFSPRHPTLTAFKPSTLHLPRCAVSFFFILGGFVSSRLAFCFRGRIPKVLAASSIPGYFYIKKCRDWGRKIQNKK